MSFVNTNENMNKIDSKKKDFFLNLNAKTWTRDSYGLFDYENPQGSQYEENISENGFLFRKKMEIKLIKSHINIKDEEFLLEIKSEKCKKKFKN
jgi:hypothetical protein